MRFVATEFGVTLEATDLKSSVKCNALGANVLETGLALIPTETFGSMLKKSNEEDLLLEVNSSRGLLRAGRNKIRFPIMPIEEFPQIPTIEGANYVCEINANSLIKLINEGSAAASQPQDFPRYLGTCLLKLEDYYLKAVSTDGKRLAVAKVPCVENNGIEDDMLVLAQSLKEVGKTLISISDTNVKIYADAATVWFQVENIEFSLRKVDATFPQYNRILNDEVYTRLKFHAPDIIPVLDRVDIIAKTHPAHIMAMTLYNNEVRVTSRSAEHGVVTEVFYGETSENGLTVGFNADFFIAGVKALGDSEGVIEFSGEDTQMRMMREGDDSFLYMLMPARLSNVDFLTDEEMEIVNV